MKYLQTLVKIPVLGPDPPSFLLHGQLIELELARQVQLAPPVMDEEASISSLIEPAEVEPRVATPTSSMTSSVFDSQFGSGFGVGYDFTADRSPVKTKDDRYVCGYTLWPET